MRDWNECYTRYMNRQCSPEEVRVLLEHFQLEGHASALRERIETELGNQVLPDADTAEVTATFQRIQQRLAEHTAAIDTSTGRIRRLRWLGYAASVLAIFTLGWLVFERTTQPEVPSPVNAADIAPGGNRATLTLADGTTVDLSSEQAGIVVADGITYLDGSTVLGESASEEPHGLANSQPYTLTTPKGGTYQVTLPDGSEVWLNAASTLTYPSRFDEAERVVYLEGEAYFEVRRSGAQTQERTNSRQRPFKVIANGQTVEVLGTGFNVSAYRDEAEVRTTLVHGKVNVVTEHHGTLGLEPGEQASLKGNALTKKALDVSSVIAWKRGLFSFDDTELATVMNQLARWFDLDVAYTEGIPPTYYYGAISRQEHLDKVLDLLRASGLKFNVERINNNNRLTVLP